MTIMLVLGCCAVGAGAASAAPVWPAASELTLPANAQTSAGAQNADLYAVSCTSPGNCVGGGTYTDSSGIQQPMVAPETNGTWGQGSELALPANAKTSTGSQHAFIYGLSCASPGNCAASGGYTATDGTVQAMVATETAGTWSGASEVPLPANATAGTLQYAVFQSVSCSSPGDCVAVGSYYINSVAEFGYQPMAVTETNGTWGQATELTVPPANASPTGTYNLLNGVTCTSAGNCVAVGDYTDTVGDYEPMVIVETNGTWGQGSELSVPPGALPSTGSQQVFLDGVTCTSPGNCVTVGDFLGPHGANDDEPMVVAETNGAWGQASELTYPSDVSTTADNQDGSGLYGVACSGAGNCVAVGDYVDTSNDYQGMTIAETNGTWGQALKQAAPTHVNAGLTAVSCTGPGECSAVGDFTDSTGSTQAMTVDSVPSLAVSTTTLPAAVAGTPYAALLSATGGAGRYTWSLASGSLPAGLTLNPATGVISGVPTAVGTSGFAAAVSDPGPPAQEVSARFGLAVSAAPPGTQTTTAKFDNQQITLTLTTPSLLACTASTGKLRVTPTSTAIPKSKATKLKFSSAAFYIGKGIKHTRHKTVRTAKGKKQKTITTYTANATARHLPTTITLSLKGLKHGTQTLKVILSYKETVRKHGHKKTLTVTKTLKVKFKVC